MTRYRDITAARKAGYMLAGGRLPAAPVAAAFVALLVLYWTADWWWHLPEVPRYLLLFGFPGGAAAVVMMGRYRGRSATGWMFALVERAVWGRRPVYLGRPMRSTRHHVVDRVRRAGR